MKQKNAFLYNHGHGGVLLILEEENLITSDLLWAMVKNGFDPESDHTGIFFAYSFPTSHRESPLDPESIDYLNKIAYKKK